MRSLALLASVVPTTACLNPYTCASEYRFAEYKGRLGLDEPLHEELDIRDPGRIFLSLDQTRGSGAQKSVTVSVNVWSFADTVAEIHVHERTGVHAGRLLFSTSNGYMVRDSVWNGYPQLHSGPVSWDSFWTQLEGDNAYLEVHPGDGAPPVRGRLTLVRTRGYQPGCT